MNKQNVLDVLSGVSLPEDEGDVVSSGVIAGCSACDGFVSVAVAAAGMSAAKRDVLKRTIEGAVRSAAKAGNELLVEVNIEMKEQSPGGRPARSVPLDQAAPAAAKAGAGGHAPISGPRGPLGGSAGAAPGAQALPNVKHIVAVGAGKGGVGKSTVAVNLAVGLALRGHAVGLLDGDIYGPSLPTMLGLDSLTANLLGNMLQPFFVHGVKAMTIGKLVDPEKPLIWRGPMAHGAFKQLVEQTQWGPLDYLIIDLPPGTGDVALTMAQMLKLTGAVVVCTPQKVAQDDAVRALRMFQQLNVEVLGVVENMSYFLADDLSPPREYDLFGRGGAQLMAQRTGVPFLGSVPITISLRKNSDSGDPSANFKGDTALSRALDGMVKSVEAQVALAGFRSGGRAPTLTVS
ncbi:MAG: Mrp/NBP35 family ATP-binding protein [Phycisphaerales bacterium]|nr:Mrp/NBP35 family ATP-binding protein [Phycisphaerales bacterium]